MDRLPTLLLLAPPARNLENTHIPEPVAGTTSAVRKFEWTENALHTGLSCNLPILLSASNEFADTAKRTLPGNSIIATNIQSAGISVSDIYAILIAAGVTANPNSNGWIATPISTPISVETIQKIVRAMEFYPMVSTQCGQTIGFPLGFSSEFYSELTQLQNERDLTKLTSRYPSQTVVASDLNPFINWSTDKCALVAPLANPQQRYAM